MEPADGGSDAGNEPLNFDGAFIFHRSDPVDDLLILFQPSLISSAAASGILKSLLTVSGAVGTDLPRRTSKTLSAWDARARSFLRKASTEDLHTAQAFCGLGARIQSYACILLAAACTFDSDGTGVSEEVAPFGEATI